MRPLGHCDSVDRGAGKVPGDLNICVIFVIKICVVMLDRILWSVIVSATNENL